MANRDGNSRPKLLRAIADREAAQARVDEMWELIVDLMEQACIAKREKLAAGAVVRLWKSYQKRYMWAECGVVRAYADALTELASATQSVNSMSPEPPLFAAKTEPPKTWHRTTPPWEAGPS